MKRHKPTKEEIESSKRYKNLPDKEVSCSKCGMLEIVGPDVKSVICSTCVAIMVAPPENLYKHVPDEKRPRGWHRKPIYVSPSGKTYRYGKEVA